LAIAYGTCRPDRQTDRQTHIQTHESTFDLSLDWLSLKHHVNRITSTQGRLSSLKTLEQDPPTGGPRRQPHRRKA